MTSVYGFGGIHYEAQYETNSVCYRLSAADHADAALWLVLAQHNPVARIELLKLPKASTSSKLDLLGRMLSVAQALARRSKSKRVVKVTATADTVELFKAAGFKRAGPPLEYTLDLLPETKPELRA